MNASTNMKMEIAAGINVKSTKLTRSLVIDGISEVYPVHRIRIDLLRYNPQNDRIATWVSKYKAENDGMLPDESDVEAYNEVIEGFVVESNEEAIRRTANHIKAFGQQVAAVVLSNGLVVDGNRRFTCLRIAARAGQPPRVRMRALACARGIAKRVYQ